MIDVHKHNRSPKTTDDATILESEPWTEARAWKPKPVGLSRYAPVTPFYMMWLECGDEGKEMMEDDQGWDTFKEGRRAYQRSIARGAIVCVAGSSSVTLRVGGKKRAVQIRKHLEAKLTVSVVLALISGRCWSGARERCVVVGGRW